MTLRTFGQESRDAEAQAGVVERTSPEIAHAAALTVCRHAIDADDARELLAMLGLRGAA